MSDESRSMSGQNPADESVADGSSLLIGLIMLTLVLLFLGGVYFDRHSGWFNPQVYSPYASTEQLAATQPQSGAAAAAAHGKKVYETACGICHGTDGLGKPGQAPALAGSEWVNAKGSKALILIPQVGLTGPMQVSGKDWNMQMAPMGAALSDADLAAVLTYIRGAWGNKAGEVTADKVKSARTSLGARPQSLTGEQLKSMSE